MEKRKKIITFSVHWSYIVEVESDEELELKTQELETEIYEQIESGYLNRELLTEIEDL